MIAIGSRKDACLSNNSYIQKRQKRAEPEQPKIGLMRSFGETISNAASNPFSKFVEVDEWFASKKNQLDALEAQLKALLKSVESVVKQRKGKKKRKKKIYKVHKSVSQY